MLKAEWLEAFATFADHLNFTRAAKALHLSEPAVHAQVKRLSDAVGVPLYQRKGQRLVLTEHGKRVATAGRDLHARTERLLAELGHGGRDGAVVLCAGEGAYLYLLGEGLGRFMSSNASRLTLLTRDHEGTLEAVRGGEAQLGVAALSEPPSDLNARLLAEIRQVVLLPEHHPAATRATLRLRDLAGERLVVPPPGRPHRVALANALRNAGVTWEVAVEASGWELMSRFVEIGLGLAVVNAFCRVPPGCVARPITGLSTQTYFVLVRTEPEGATARLREALLATTHGWRP